MPFDPIGWSPPPSPEPRPRMSKRAETMLIWWLCLLLVAIFVAPIGGGSVLYILAYLMR